MDSVKLFHEKLAILNSEFVEFVSTAYKENPAYDLTPSLNDYLTHVKELDKLYTKQGERKIAVAKRKKTMTSSCSAKKRRQVSPPPTVSVMPFNLGTTPIVNTSKAPTLNTSPAFTSPTLNTSSTSANPLFGGIVKTSGLLSFNFSPLSNGTVTNGEKKVEEGEEVEGEDAPPPKVEAMKYEEKEAVFDVKCVLFNLSGKEYTKAGVCYLYIKKTDKGTQLLVRAANSLATILVNTFINDSFKAEKKIKDKIQFSYPGTEGAKTHLIRVVESFDECLSYLTGEKKL